MLHEERTDVSGLDPGDLHAAHCSDLASIVEERGVETVAVETGVDGERLERLVSESAVDLPLSDAAAVQSLAPAAPDPEEIEAVACDHLLLGMTTAVMDVEALAGAVDLDLTAKEIQQKVERRAPVTLEEFAHLQHAVARNR